MSNARLTEDSRTTHGGLTPGYGRDHWKGSLEGKSGESFEHGIQSVACASASNAMPELRSDPLEGLDFDVMCEAQPDPCPNAASWVISCTACGGNGLLCGTHLVIKAHAMAQHAAHGRQARCGRCGKVRPALELFTWRPL